MARTRRLALWQRLCCASLATLLATSICVAVLHGLLASGSPVTAMRDENGRSAEIQVSVICAATPAESVPVVRLKSAPEFAPKSALINGDALPGKRTYLPAGKLSERPMILQDIEPLLTNAGQSGLELQPELEPELQMVLQLLINEYGDVDQVLLEDTTLPAQIVQELQQRFLLARFLPGRLQGLAVPSALRIVVTLQTP